jgi:endonuclease/exonuclease/phosphatase family metal-dependent hydrolase
MKILHWNIHMWQDADGVDNVARVGDLVEAEQPDVVTLVEVDEQWGRPARLQSLAERLGYCWAFIPAFEYRTEGGFGNAILSKAPFLTVEQWQLLPPMLYDSTERSEPRTLLLARLAWPDGPPRGTVAVGATHFPRSDNKMRRIASDQLLHLVDRLAHPWVVCGDFNQPATAWDLDGHQVAPVDDAPTFPANHPVEAIDYCLAGRISTLSAHAINADGSDHNPIVASIQGELNPSGGTS